MKMESCNLCPRHCNVDRTQNKKGYCGETMAVRIGRAALHMWEEPCISGQTGSGAVFFSGCALKCIFCQNGRLSDSSVGKEVSIQELANIFMKLQKQGAANINLVTASHYVPQIIEALRISKKEGLTIPIVYNCGGYENADTIQQLNGFVDIYLPDMKYFDCELSADFAHAPDYFEKAQAAIREMVLQRGIPVFDDNGMMKSGVIVRHLLLPGHTKDSKRVLQYLYETYGDRIYISIMNQYTPVLHQQKYPELNRKVTKREYEKILDYALSLGISNAFIQEGETAKESFIPVFDYEGVVADRQF